MNINDLTLGCSSFMKWGDGSETTIDLYAHLVDYDIISIEELKGQPLSHIWKPLLTEQEKQAQNDYIKLHSLPF